MSEISTTLPAVLEFAGRMEAKLALNRHKGDRAGWLKDEFLFDRLTHEVDELRESIECNFSPEQIILECVDVANFAMMLADQIKTESLKTAPENLE